MYSKKSILSISFLFLALVFFSSCTKDSIDEVQKDEILLEKDIHATEKGSTISIGGSSDSGDDDHN